MFKYMKPFRLVLFLICASSFTLLSQNESEYERLLLEIENSTYYDSTKVYERGRRAIQIAKENNDLSKVAKVYQYYGNYNYLLGKIDLSFAYYDTSIVYASEVHDSTLIYATKIRRNFLNVETRANEASRKFKNYFEKVKERGDTNSMVISLNGLATCSELTNKPNQALKYYLDAYEIAVAADDTFLKAMLLSNIGLIKFSNKQYDKALQDFQLGIELAENLENYRLKFYLNTNIGLVYDRLDMLEESIIYFRKSLDKANELGFPYTKAITHLNLSAAYQKSNEPNLAFLHADSSYHLFIQQSYLQHIAKPFIIKVDSYLTKGDFDQALTLIDSAIYYSKLNENLDDVLESYKLKSKIYRKMELFEEALETYMMYSETKDSTEEVKNQKQFAELQVIYDTEKKEAELEHERTRISILEKDNKLYQSRVFNVVFFSVIILLIGVVFFYLRYIQSRRKQQALFSQQLISRIDDERSRISKDLHDDIGQSLSVAKSKINLYNKGQLDSVEDMEESLGELIQQVRVLSHELHPSFLEKIGLKRSIISLLDKIEKSTQLITSYKLFDEIDKLDLHIQNQLYRITQESINNTIKHAEAKSIKVTLKTVGNSFFYIYRDNGKGFDSSLDLGFGISAMKERSNKIGGKFSLFSEPGKGVKMIIKFPKK